MDLTSQREGERVQTEMSCLVQIRSRAEKGAVMHRNVGLETGCLGCGFDVAFSEKEHVL
jgi:hypothetical protein